MQEQQIEKNERIRQLEDEVDALRQQIEHLKLKMVENSLRSDEEVTRIDLSCLAPMEE